MCCLHQIGSGLFYTKMKQVLHASFQLLLIKSRMNKLNNRLGLSRQVEYHPTFDALETSTSCQSLLELITESRRHPKGQRMDIQTFVKAEEECCKRLISSENQGSNCHPSSLPELATSPTALNSDRQTLAKFSRWFRTLPLPSVHSFPNPLPGKAKPVRGENGVHRVLRCP